MTTHTSISPRSTTVPAARAAAVLSVTVTALAAAWALSPADAPVADPGLSIGARFAGPDVMVGLVLAAAVAGSVAAVRLTLGRGPVPSGLLAVAAAEVAVFGLVLQGVRAIALAGYLVAMALPLVLLGVGVLVVRRSRGLRLPVLLTGAGLVAWGATTGSLAPDAVGRLAGEIAHGFADEAAALVVTVLFLGLAGCWTVVLVSLVQSTPRAAAVSRWAVRRRTGLTVVAAVCALPYGLVRMTWLTPWPLLAPGGDELSPEVRLWGLLLGGGALLGFTLTMGLVRPWGERFPRWIPRLAGRPVPVAMAVVPGLLVAGIVTASAPGMLVELSLTENGGGVGVDSVTARVLAALVFPFWLWGPALALAVWGYAGHRRGVLEGAGRLRD